MSSSDEDFSLTMEPNSGKALEDFQTSISNYKKRYQQLVEEQNELSSSRDENRELAEKFRLRRDKLVVQMEEDERAHGQQMADEKVKLNHQLLEESKLKEELQKMEAELSAKKTQNQDLRQQMDVFASVPERKMVFRDQTADPSATPMFDMKSHIVYPMDGGTALITFEEEAVAKKILAVKRHRVALECDCSITVEAEPVFLMLPRLVEIDTDICPRRILISDLPNMDTDTLLNKLEIHFSKSKNGGGEVDDCEMLPDSRTVVITFMDKTIAKGLTETQHHDVKLKQKKHRVRVTPFLNGRISCFKTKVMACPRTVLLTGIPDVMEREALEELMEIHFQKNSNSGGEIEAFFYNPLGQHTAALFGDAKSSETKEEGEGGADDDDEHIYKM